jgi:predicted nucleic acid-binding Zn ribbon protein
MQKVTDPPIEKCIRCQGSVKKLISPPALQFKGSGWYITDYASKEKSAPKPKEKDTAKKDGDSSEEKKSAGSSSPTKK